MTTHELEQGTSSSRIDPHKSAFIDVFGRKGSGKSVLARHIFTSYPKDRLVVDITGDEHLEHVPNVKTIRDPLPGSWPVDFNVLGPSKVRQTLRYVPDAGLPTYRENLDAAVGLAYQHRDCLAWLDEVGALTKGNRTGPWFMRALHQGRHQGLSLLMCGPRPVDIDPLVLSQADLIYVFQMPHPHDRERVAAAIGWPPKEFGTIVDGLERYHYLEYNALTQELTQYPPLPTPLEPRQREQHHDPDR